MCMALVFGTDIIIAASWREPRDIAVMRVEASVTVASRSPASSAYSSELTFTVWGAVPRTIPAFGESWVGNILQRPAINTTGEKMSPWSTPCEMLNGLLVSLPILTHPSHLQ